MERSVEALLANGLAELELDTAAARPLAALSRLVERWGARLNLTGHRTALDIAHHLVLDAAALSCVLPLEGVRSIADLGSGAGFPGLPLALLLPDVELTLVEARERRHHFQRAAVRELGVVNATPRLGRAEAIEASPHDLVVAQAVADPRQLARLADPWMAPAGWLAVPRSDSQPLPGCPPGLEPARPRPYRVPQGGRARTLWLARRTPAGAPARQS